MKRSLPASIVFTLAVAMTFTDQAFSANIERSTITQVVKDATVLQRATKGRKPARVNDVFGVPDVLRTGTDSRVEMIAEDQTVTRVGANTIFSFEPQKREINLEKGSVLFNSPTGKGGGTIRTAAATAAVQGTTLIVVTTQNGGFKTLLLEGRGRVKTANGKTRILAAGQMVYVLPGGDLSGVLTFHLAEQVGVARLVNGFKQPLPSKEKIDAAVVKQDVQIAKGQLVTTGLLASDLPTQAYKVDMTVALEVIREQEQAREVVVETIVDSVQARLLDATITAPQLDPDRVFTAASDLDGIFGPGTGVGSEIPPDFAVFIARNTTVQTSTIDLSPYPGTFLFYSTGDFILSQNVAILGGTQSVGIIAGGTIQQAPGAFLDIDSPNAFVFTIGAGITPEEVAPPIGSPLVLVDGGIRSTGNLSLFSSSIDLNRSVLASQSGGLAVSASGDFNAIGLGGTAPQFVAPQGISLFAGGSIDISNSIVSTPNANFFAQNNLVLDKVGFLTAGGSALSTNLNAVNNMSLSNVGFRSENVNLQSQNMRLTEVVFQPGNAGAGNASLNASGAMLLSGVNFRSQAISLEARTMALTNVAFPNNSTVRLRSQTGTLAARPNTGQPVELGKVNFIRNVTYGGAPAQNRIGEGIIITK